MKLGFLLAALPGLAVDTATTGGAARGTPSTTTVVGRLATSREST
jgi:hypothetical protein